MYVAPKIAKDFSNYMQSELSFFCVSNFFLSNPNVLSHILGEIKYFSGEFLLSIQLNMLLYLLYVLHLPIFRLDHD